MNLITVKFPKHKVAFLEYTTVNRIRVTVAVYYI